MGTLNVPEWSPDQVAEWLNGLGPLVARYVPALRARGLDGAKLLTLRCDDLEYLGMRVIGHQEILLEAIDQLRNFQYEVSRECVQQLALRVSVAAGGVARALRPGGAARPDARLETQALMDVARAVAAVKALVCWLERWAAGALRSRAGALLALCLEAATCAQRDRFAEQPARAVHRAAHAAALLADHIVQDVMDPLILQPASLDLVTLKQGAKPLGFSVVPSFCGHQQLAGIRFGSPAHASGAVHEGDEIVQVFNQCVIGWSGAAVERACAARGPAGELTLRLRRRYSRAPRPVPRARSRLEALEVKRESLHPPPGALDALDARDGRDADSSSDSEPLSPPASPTLPLDHTRMYPPKPRALARRRHSVSGASPAARRAHLGIDQLWQELKQQQWRAGGSASVSPEPLEALYRRDKAVSCSTGLELSPRPRTCLGVALHRPLADKLADKLAGKLAQPPAEDEEAREARSRGKLDKSHSTPAYDFAGAPADERPSLLAQTIPESPTTPTDSPSILVHSAEKADQILDFKKSSSQIEEAILQQKNRRLTDERNEFSFSDEKTDDSEPVETVNLVVTESRRASLKSPRSEGRKCSAGEPVPEARNPAPAARARPAAPPSPPPRPRAAPPPAHPAPPAYPALRAVRQPAHPLDPLKPIKLNDPTQLSTPLRHVSRHDIRAAGSERREPAARAAGMTAGPSLGAEFPLQEPSGAGAGAVSPSGMRAMFPTYKSKSLKKKNSILAKRRSIAARTLAGRGAGGAVWQRVRARHAQQPRWARRYLLLADTTLYAYRSADCARADCMIQLAGFTAAAAGEVKSRPHAFKVYHTGTAFYFACESADAARAWLALIQRAILHDQPRPSGDLPKQYSETEYSTNSEGDERPRERDREMKDKDKDKSKFGSLKKLTHRMQRSESSETVSGAAASLDRKYLRFFSRAKHKDDKPSKSKVCVPVPTEHYRSYRRVSGAAPASAPAPAPAARPKPINYIHASNPNLLDFEKSDLVARPARAPLAPHARPDLRKPDNFVGYVTLEAFMLKKQEEERRQVYTNRVLLGVERGERDASLQRRLQEVVPDVLYGALPGPPSPPASSGLPLPVQELQARSLPRAPPAPPAPAAPPAPPARPGQPVSVKGKDGYEKIVYTEEKPSRERMRRASPPAEELGYETIYGSPRAHERWRDSLRRNDKVHSGAVGAVGASGASGASGAGGASGANGAGGAARRVAPLAPLQAAAAVESVSGSAGVSRLRLMFSGRSVSRETHRQEWTAGGPAEWAARAQYPHLQCPPTFQPETYSLASRLPRPPSD